LEILQTKAGKTGLIRISLPLEATVSLPM
jgi:hypothetical protein